MDAATEGSSYFEVEDLVRLKGSGRLALIARLPGSDDSSDDEDSYADDDDASSTGSVTDERGRLTRWVDGIPGVSSLADQRRRDADGRHLISSYDDDAMEVDDEPDELPVIDETDDKPAHANGLLGANLQDGQALIMIAATGDKVVHSIKDLELLDRNFNPSLLAAWAPAGAPPTRDPAAQQSGIVEAVRKTVIVRRVRDILPSTAEFPDPATCFQIPTERLGFFSGVRAGDTVVRGSWVGIIVYFQEDVYVEFSDGAIACVPGHRKALQNVDKRTPDRSRPDPFSEGLYFPGQRVRSLPEVWQTMATWIRGSYSGKDEGVVKSIAIGDVGIEWAAKSMYADASDEGGRDPTVNEGVEVVQFSDVTLLEGFRNLWWSVGDRGYLLDPDGSGKAMENSATDSTDTEAPHFPANAPGTQEDDEEEWEEDTSDDQSGAGPSPSPDVVPRRTRSKRAGGRLMEAQRRARERSAAGGHVSTVADATLANPSSNPDDVVQIVRTKSSVDVLWQDGTRSEDIPTVNLRTINHPDPYDFWPGSIVLKVDEDIPGPQNDDRKPRALLPHEKRRGAVIRVNQNDRTAIVKWQVEADGAFEVEEEMSVYELNADEYEVDVGDTVLHAPNNAPPYEPLKEWVGVITRQTMGQCTVAWNGGTVSTVPTKELLYISGGDDDSYDETALSTTDVESEHNTTGMQGSSRPRGMVQAAQHVPHDPDYHHNWGSDDEGETNQEQMEVNASYGMAVITSLLTTTEISRFRHDLDMREAESCLQRVKEKIAEELEEKRYASDGTPTRRRISGTEERQVAGSMVFRLLGEMLSQTLRPVHEPSEHQDVLEAASYGNWTLFVQSVQAAYGVIMRREMELLASPGLSQRDQETTQLNDAITNGTPAIDASNAMELVEQHNEDGQISDDEGLQRFQMVEEIKDFHSFPSASSASGHGAGFVTVVHKEWNRLRKHLPPGVVVRACESKLDRLRAGIVGPQGTPYADVIFFFDIRLGPSYPMMPPLVWFHSHGRRINPNLYEDGKVCLSILGTWDGDVVESWDAKTSNLLRVLLSLQALVFVEDPYYNEAGYSKQRGTQEGRHNSRMYNESAFLLCLRYVIQTLKKGGVPEDCAEVAAAHYRSAGPRILERCRQLTQSEDAMLTPANSRSGEGGRQDQKPYSSAGFRKSLAQLMQPLQKALSFEADQSDS